MKRMLFVSMLLFSLIFAGLSSVEAANLRIGIVLGLGGLGDQSFSDLAYSGMMRAKEELGITFDYVEPQDISEMEDHQRAFAAAGYDLVIAISFSQETALREVAADYPNIKFAIVDGNVNMPNVKSLTFKEHEGSFLVGMVAGMMTETNTVGFVGGMEVPVIRKFQSGYEQGVAYVSDARVLVNYAGSFRDPGMGKELALSQFERGADIVYHAASGTGIGVIEAGQEVQKFVIGVDSDQDHLAPGFVLTSMLKKVDVAIYDTIQELIAGRFAPGIHSLGIAEGAVGTSAFRFTKDIVPVEVFDALDDAINKIKSGELVVIDPTAR